MNLTFEDVCDRLKQLDEITLLEILDISSEEIVDRFRDLIENKFDDFKEELSDETDE